MYDCRSMAAEATDQLWAGNQAIVLLRKGYLLDVR